MPDLKTIILTSARAIIPVALLIVVARFTMVRVEDDLFFQFLVGIILTIAGLVLFFLGAHLGLLPLGEHFGEMLAGTGKLWVLIVFAAVIGYAVTVAEPSVRVLAGHAEAASHDTVSKGLLIHTIGLGVAFFLALAVFRMVRGVSLKGILIVSYSLIGVLSFFARDSFIPVSYDSGGVTTGTVTVPFVLALGMGMALTLRGSDSSSESFGMIGLASIGPILAMLILGIFLR
ncbi:MAG: DUF1538 domain-containing protein [Candidatus Omnitrophica bacterium]|nr:DUF1538 domain-containing protein [Candidatus Omnitrophota bacterium]